MLHGIGDLQPTEPFHVTGLERPAEGCHGLGIAPRSSLALIGRLLSFARWSNYGIGIVVVMELLATQRDPAMGFGWLVGGVFRFSRSGRGPA
ncbi:unnamed protein product [Phytomonas sp. Hart1]|nr:unnamed protein product [Phytomonas sp. Hart1]|eukprot:CCW72289.1 unnamed protein product [Phytomonas sp. isolate Hart1]